MIAAVASTKHGGRKLRIYDACKRYQGSLHALRDFVNKAKLEGKCLSKTNEEFAELHAQITMDSPNNSALTELLSIPPLLHQMKIIRKDIEKIFIDAQCVRRRDLQHNEKSRLRRYIRVILAAASTREGGRTLGKDAAVKRYSSRWGLCMDYISYEKSQGRTLYRNDEEMDDLHSDLNWLQTEMGEPQVSFETAPVWFIPRFHVGSNLNAVGRRQPLPQVTTPPNMRELLLKRTMALLGNETRKIMGAIPYNARCQRWNSAVTAMIFGQKQSEPIYSDLDAFLLIAERADELLGCKPIERSVPHRGCMYSLDMRSLPEMARVIGLPLSDFLSWAVNREEVGNTGEFVHVANFPCIRGYKLSLGSEQRCIQINGLDGDSIHCVHLPIAEWHEGDWATGFEFERSPGTDTISCQHWKGDRTKIEELEGSYRIEWKWPSGKLKSQCIGAMYISVPAILLRGRAADRVMNSLHARIRDLNIAN